MEVRTGARKRAQAAEDPAAERIVLVMKDSDGVRWEIGRVVAEGVVLDQRGSWAGKGLAS